MIKKLFPYKTVVAITAVIAFFGVGLYQIHGQANPLTLAEILTGLQSKSGGFSIAEKNRFITQKVRERGVTFRTSPTIETELRNAGASTTLISAIRTNSPKAVIPTVNKPVGADIKFDKIWVDYNVTVSGVKGMRVHSKFTVNNLKGVPLYMTLRFVKEDGIAITNADGSQYKVKKLLKPGYATAVYSDYNVFVPYTGIRVPPGQHNLSIDADIYYADNELLKHMGVKKFSFTKPDPANATKPSVKSERIWIDYNVTRDGAKGMVVHVKMSVKNLKSKPIQLAVAVETNEGEKVFGITQRSVNGQLTVYRSLRPRFDATIFNDANVFIPYSEFKLEPGVHNLRVHADILYTATKLNLHVGYHNFRFTQRKPNEVF